MATTADTASTRSTHSAARCQSGAGASIRRGGRTGGRAVGVAARAGWRSVRFTGKTPSGVVT